MWFMPSFLSRGYAFFFRSLTSSVARLTKGSDLYGYAEGKEKNILKISTINNGVVKRNGTAVAGISTINVNSDDAVMVVMHGM